MHTLSDLNACELDMDRTSAFLAKGLLRTPIAAYADDPLALSQMLASRGLTKPVAALVTKAATAPLDLSTGPGVGSRPLAMAFLQAVAQRSVLGRLGAVRVSGMATATTEVTAPTCYWVGEASAKPVSAFTFAAANLRALKLISQVALSRELVELGSPDALSLVQRSLVTAAAAALNTALLDPASVAIANVKPGSLTSTLVTIPPLLDFQNQVGQVLAGISGGAPSRPVLIVSLQTALRLQGIRDLEAMGVTVLITPAAANKLIAVDADRVIVIDENAEIRVGTPDIELLDNPATPATSSSTYASTWQRNLQVVRVEHWCNWTAAADAAAMLTLA